MVDVLGVLLDFLSAMIIMCMIEREFLMKNMMKNILAVTIVVVGGTIVGLDICRKYSQPFLDLNTLFVCESNENPTHSLIKIIIYAIALAVCCELTWKDYLFSFIGSQIVVGVVEAVVLLPTQEAFLHMFLLKKIVVLIILVAGGVIAIRGFKININFAELSKKLLAEIAILFSLLIVFIAGIIVLLNGGGIKSTKSIVTTLAIIICLGIFAIVAEGIMLEMSKLSLEKENVILQRYNEQQKSYYELVLKNEEDTRRFRHDVLNHIMCLEDYLNSGDVEQCKKYLATMTEEINVNRKQLFHTGNRIADVMLTNILSNKKEDVKVSVTGNLKENLSIEDYDLVVVISNILKNAVEAVNNQSDISDKFINVNFIVGKKYLRIEEHNSIDDSQVKSAQKLETTKSDKKSHGIGTKNIKRIADKYDGVFKTEVNDSEFAIIVELSLKKQLS